MHYSTPYMNNMGHMTMGGGGNTANMSAMNMNMGHMGMGNGMGMMLSDSNNYSVHQPPSLDSPHHYHYHHPSHNNHNNHHHSSNSNHHHHNHYGPPASNSNSPNSYVHHGGSGSHGPSHSGHNHGGHSQGHGHGHGHGQNYGQHHSMGHGHSKHHGQGQGSGHSGQGHNFGSNLGQEESGWPWRCAKSSCPNFASIFCPRCEAVAYCCEPHRMEEEVNHECSPETNFTYLQGPSASSSASSTSSSNSDFNLNLNLNHNNSRHNHNSSSSSKSSSSMEKIYTAQGQGHQSTSSSSTSTSTDSSSRSNSNSNSSSSSNNSCFSFLFTNNLGPGDTVCRIRPKMMIPHDKDLPGPANSSLCLGCCKWFPSNSYKCSKCSWPVCSYHCENNSLHASYECNTFMACNVPVIYFPGIYDALLALRCISLFNYDPGFWKAFQNWNTFMDHHQAMMEQQQQQQNGQRPSSAPPLDALLAAPSVSVNLNSNLNINVDAITIKFLLKDCRLGSDYYTPDALRNVLRFLSSNSLCQENQVSIYDVQDTRSYHSAKYVFPYKYVYGHHCNPNVTWTINYGPTLKEANLHIWTTTSVKIGDKLTACFALSFPEYGTLERRSLQRLHEQEPCQCDRCSDPTELNSMASAISCDECDQGESGKGGFLLPVNPLMDSSRWKCSNKACGRIVESEFVCSKFLQVSREICEVKEDLSGLLKIIKKLELVLHPNHYLIAQAANYVVEMGWADVRRRLVTSYKSLDFAPFLKAGQICLDFADKVSPGLTTHRAKYVYFLQMISGISELQNALFYHQNNMLVEGRLIRENFDVIHLYQKHCQKILLRKKMGSREFEWMEPLAKSIDDLGELLRVTVRQRAFDTYSLERLQKAFSYFCSEEYEPNLPPELQVDLSPVLTEREVKPTRLEYKTFFGF